MKVICIDNCNCETALTVGRLYEVIESTSKHYKIKNDNDIPLRFSKDRFIIAKGKQMYNVGVKEELITSIKIEAESPEEAMKTVREMYEYGKIELTYDNITEESFKVWDKNFTTIIDWGEE